MEETEEEDRKREIDRHLYQVRYHFKEKFGIELTTKYKWEPNKPTNNLIPLEVITAAADAVLNTLTEMQYTNGIKSIYHDENVLLCRWCYYYIAISMGHRRTRTARYIKQSSESVGYGLGKIKKLISIEGKEKTVYLKIKNELERTVYKNIDTI